MTPGSEVRGLLDMVLASMLFSSMALCVYVLSEGPDALDPPVISLIRVLVNLILIVIPALSGSGFRRLLGDLRPSLWLRGLFGGASLMLSFLSIERIGPGESAFLTSTSGLFVAILSPYVLGQPQRLLDWIAILLGLVGLYFLMEPQEFQQDLSGRLMGLSSGVLAALAYLMVSRSARSNPPVTVVFYFCLMALILHVAWFSQVGLSLPGDPDGLLLALGAGLLGSLAQFFLTRAYQRAPAVLVSAVAYLAPVLSLLLGAIVLGLVPSPRALWGSGLILLAGILIPLFRSASRARKREIQPKSFP